MFYGSIGDTKFSKNVSNHLRDDLDASEVLAIVNSNGEVHHLRKYDHIATVSANNDVLTLSLLLSSCPEFQKQFLLTWG